MKISWARETLEHLIEIEEYIVKDSPARAATFVDELVDHAETAVAENPQIGRMVPEIARPEIRELIHRKYRIVYRVKESGVEILTVFEGHRLLLSDEVSS
jgi:plasmid stabilization system protein ParE